MGQKAELRLVTRRGEEYGLLWQANLISHDVYAGTPHPAVWTKISYHASGAGHIHVTPAGDRIIGPPSQPTKGLRGKEKVGGWSHQFTQWGYRLKPNTTRRKNLVLEEPYPRPLTVDLWLLQKDTPALVNEVLSEYREVLRVISPLHVAGTDPELFAVVYTMSGPVVESVLEQTDHETQRRYL